MLDGLGKIPDYVKRASELGMKHLGISDHGTVSGAWEFYTACRKADIEPVLGCEFYFVPDAEAVKAEKTGERFHVTMLAKNEQGFKTITELVTEAHKRFYYKPVLDRALLESLGDAANNLVCFSGCAGSIISRLLMSKSKEKRAGAYDEMRWWLSIFNAHNYYTEIMAHGTDDEVKLNTRLLKLATKLDIPHVITNDPHYVHKEEHAHHDALLAIQTASDVDDPTRFRFDGDGYHLRSRQELRKAFDQYRKRVVRAGLDNSVRVAELCHTRIGPWENKTWHIPKFPKLPSKYNGDSYAYLRRITMRGLRERGLDRDPRYVERAKYELKKLKTANMADFLLITWEAINWAKRRGIAVGPGRGSICGCLVAYLIGIHKIDSIRGGLLFERFLNPERPKAPDVDSDFEPERRQEVIDHYIKLYGADNVVRVAAFQTMKIASVFQTVARAHGISSEDRNRLTKELGKFKSDEEIEDEEEEYEDINVLPEEIRDTYPDMAVQMKHLLGTKKAISRHAAGVIIFDPHDPIKDLVGLQWLPKKDAPGGGNWAAQYDLKSVEGMMLMKQDTLGLRTLSTIKECVRMVKVNHGVELDVDSWVPDEEPDDDKVYQMLADGRTGGVFQMEGGSNTRGIQEIKPHRFEDIVTCTALYRAGPMSAGSDKRFLKNRADDKVRVIHESLKPILRPSMGEMIYDEQMLEIMFRCAGFSWARTDDVKTAMKKKDPSMMAALKDEAIDGFAQTSGMSKKQARKTWEMIEAQSSYLFNRSHAYAYSTTTYITARLKCLYPLEFMTALVRTVKADKDHLKKRMGYVGELAEMGYKILSPDVNQSDAKATCGYKKNGKGWFRFGFTDCSGIGDSKAKKILAARDDADSGVYGFYSPEDVKDSVDKAAYEVLARVGALESIGGPATSKRLKEQLIGYRFTDPMKKYRKKFEKKLIVPQDDRDYTRVYGEITSVEHRETKRGKDFVIWTVHWSPTRTFRVNVWDTRDGIKTIKRGSIVKVEGEWSADWRNISVNDSEDVVVIKEAA